MLDPVRIVRGGGGPRLVCMVLALLVGAAILVERPAAAAVYADPGCTANTLPANDDDYTGPVPLGFDVSFGNAFHSTLRISNNGYVTFGPSTPVWWMLRSWEAYNVPLIALFHHDVDTRGPGSSPVTYGPIVFEGRPALCINWVNVGYFDARDDLLNSFQLILVSRSDEGAGDFDIVMNYDSIQWDDSTQSGTVRPRAGIYNGSAVLYEVPGSNAYSTLIDGGPNALRSGTKESLVLGRYRTEVRGGLAPETAVIAGTVLDANGAPVAGALVQACGVSCLTGTSCALGSTDAAGRYTLTGLSTIDVMFCASWNVSVSPPASSELLADVINVAFTPGDTVIAGADVTLEYPEYIPSGTSITPSVGGGFGTVPRVYWQSPLTLTTTGCAGGSARYMITSDGSSDVGRCDTGTPGQDGLLRCGAMAESSAGTYTAALAQLYPAHGEVKITMELSCPSPSGPPTVGKSSFDLYIDPSGWVLTTTSYPLIGARVTLYRSESEHGPFEVIPDGSALMSPRNRRNPDVTDAAGHFGWDTVAGYYIVRAEYPGCVSPDDPLRTYVETDVLPVPPEWLDLHLYLDCGGLSPPQLALPTQVLADATSTAGAVAAFEVSAIDERDGPVPVTCSAASGALFPVGTTQVTCTATNSIGNTAEGSFPVIVTYPWSHVQSPLAPGGNRLKAGRTVPVKFALAGASAGITDLVARLYVAAVIGGVPGPELPARSAGHGDDTAFRYDPAARAYVFNWSTKHLPEGHYQIRIDLGDGTSRTVPVELR